MSGNHEQQSRPVAIVTGASGGIGEATALGALVLARAVDDPKLSDAVRDAALNHLTPTG